MKISTKPTSLVLVGILFICIFSIPALAEQQLSGLEQLNKFKEHSSFSRHYEKSSDLGILKVGEDTIYFPWFRKTPPLRPTFSGSISTSSKKEEILINSSNPVAKLGDLSAVNSLKQRDLLYRDSQNGDPSYGGLVNSQEISVGGKGNNVAKSPIKSFADGFESFSDDAAGQGRQEDDSGGPEFDRSNTHHAGNYLSVDVHDITVSAINTMEGGSAVATSNIIIEPVQMIVCPSEVETKLI
ncbi:MAG: hypothetical protein JW999_01455 [Methanotrichaceae archaeon]|nr:hypothetical protein [Methanotrichaceae archaeon]